MEASVRYLEGMKFEVLTRGHRVMCDQPVADGGADEGMSPPEFLLASLATCAGYYAMQYLRTRSLATGGLEIRVTAEKALQPARLEKFRIEILAPATGEERHREGILRAVKSCLIHNTLLNPPAIEIALGEAG